MKTVSRLLFVFVTSLFIFNTTVKAQANDQRLKKQNQIFKIVS